MSVVCCSNFLLFQEAIPLPRNVICFLAEHGGGRRMSRRMFYVGMKFCFQKAGSRHKDTGYT
ncbi:hypothetical protein BgiBS90_014901, partial [Biomphalaria glabrata]